LSPQAKASATSIWTSCAAFKLINMKVQSTACATAKPITSQGPALGSQADAVSRAASRRMDSLRRRRTRAGREDAVDMALCVARFSHQWNQLGVKLGRQNAAIWLPRRNANAIPRP